MASTSSTNTPPPPPGLVDTARSFLASWVSIIKTRVEIISLVIEEQREWLERVVVLALAALFTLGLGLLLLTLFFVVLFWDTAARLWVLGGFSLLYLAGGAALALVLKNMLAFKPKIFSATADELAKDYASLQPRNP